MPENPKVQAKILRSGQYQIDTNRYIVQAPKIFKRTKEQEIDESTKRIDDLRAEIRTLEEELSKKIEKSEHDAEEILDKAEQEARRLIDDAEKSAFDRVQKSLDEKEGVIDDKNKTIDDMIRAAQSDGENIVGEANKQAEEIKAEAREMGFNQGREQGFEFAKQEVEHMVGRLHSIIQATLDERERILVHSERQIINLVLTMVRKIVKRLSEDEQNMVVYNIQSALELIRGAMKVYIRVNPSDYRYALQHKDEFIRMIEGMPEVKFFEDPTIAKGGVFIETDIGEVDATIASQLEEIESQMKYYIPVKVKTKGLQEVQDEQRSRPDGTGSVYNENFEARPDLTTTQTADEQKKNEPLNYRATSSNIEPPVRQFVPPERQTVTPHESVVRKNIEVDTRHSPVAPPKEVDKTLAPQPKSLEVPITEAPLAANVKETPAEPGEAYSENSLTLEEDNTASVETKADKPVEKVVTPPVETNTDKYVIPESETKAEDIVIPSPADDNQDIKERQKEEEIFVDLPGVEPSAATNGDAEVFPLEDFVAPNGHSNGANPETQTDQSSEADQTPEVVEKFVEFDPLDVIDDQMMPDVMGGAEVEIKSYKSEDNLPVGNPDEDFQPL